MPSPTSQSPEITPDVILKFGKPTEKFLSPSNGMTNIRFLEFRIREMDTNKTLFEIKRSEDDASLASSMERLTTSDCEPLPRTQSREIVDAVDHSDNAQEEGRTVHYDFGAEFLSYRSIGTTLVFEVGEEEVKNFRMIERHYFKDKILKSYDFTFGYCIPNSVNTWESIYVIPEVERKLGEEMIRNPGKTVSDSFYFIDNKLVMHAKATYAFSKKT